MLIRYLLSRNWISRNAAQYSFPITTICLAIGLTLGIGGASNFNLELGKGNPEKSKHTAGTAASTLIIIGIILCITIRIFLEPLMISFGATDKNFYNMLWNIQV